MPQLPVIATFDPKDRKGNLSKTSGVFGADLSGMDSNLVLIKRKIQERCSSTHELITTIRRMKVSENRYLTPNEFKHTLIKFGIFLTPELLDQIFTKFDTAKSNSVDFDNFSRWVFAEATISTGTSKRKKHSETIRGDRTSTARESDIRKKLNDTIKRLPSFVNSRNSRLLDYDYISSACSNLPASVTLSEKEIRYLFNVLDPKNSGSISSDILMNYAKNGTGALLAPVVSDKSRYDEIPSLNECITRICGIDGTQLEKAFSKLPRNSPLRMSFEEFHQHLLAEGMGRNKRDAENLFIALGGDDKHSADINLLLCTIVNIKSEQLRQLEEQKNRKNDDIMDFPLSKQQRRELALIAAQEKNEARIKESSNSAPSATYVAPTTPNTNQSMSITASRATRRLIEAIRKCYKVVKEEIKLADMENTGYVDAEVILKVINSTCYAMPIDDFRAILQPVSSCRIITVLRIHAKYMRILCV